MTSFDMDTLPTPTFSCALNLIRFQVSCISRQDNKTKTFIVNVNSALERQKPCLWRYVCSNIRKQRSAILRRFMVKVRRKQERKLHADILCNLYTLRSTHFFLNVVQLQACVTESLNKY